jgi:hypothetical protein
METPFPTNEVLPLLLLLMLLLLMLLLLLLPLLLLILPLLLFVVVAVAVCTDLALRQEEDILIDTKQWHLHGQEYLQALFHHIGLSSAKAGDAEEVFVALLHRGSLTNNEDEDEEENPISIQVYVALEKQNVAYRYIPGESTSIVDC